MSGPDVGLVVLVAGMTVAVTAAVRSAAGRAGFDPPARARRLTAVVAVAILAWLGLTWLLAGLDVLAQWGSAVPRVILLPLAVVLHVISIRQTVPLLRGAAPTLQRTS